MDINSCQHHKTKATQATMCLPMKEHTTYLLAKGIKPASGQVPRFSIQSARNTEDSGTY